MGHRHQRADILAGAIETAFAGGLSAVTFGRVAAHLGVSDRIVVYYFATKDNLLGEVLLGLGARLREALAASLGTPVADHRALVRAAWPALAHPDADRVFALFFEASGLAAAGRAPYARAVPQLVEAWIEWAADHLTGTRQQRRRQAEAAVALVDGLLLLRQLAGPEAAERAVRTITSR